ncbi:MAG: 5-formyltetrahydrofolate cyclo-ligase [Promethearchaeota archaeon]
MNGKGIISNKKKMSINKEKLRDKIRGLKLENFANNDGDYYNLAAHMFSNAIKFPLFKNSKIIALFASKKVSYEIYTDKLINYSIGTGKTVYLPRCITETRDLEFIRILDLDGETEIGTFSLREPKKNMTTANQKEFMENLELIFVPGMAFDLYGNRLGFGSGYYDNFLNKLQKINSGVTIIGLAFGFQILNDFIPHEEHDSRVDYIISPEGIFKIKISEF